MTQPADVLVYWFGDDPTFDGSTPVETADG